MTSLHVKLRNDTIATLELRRAPIKIGRADSCDVVLRNDGEVSREHAQVWLDEGGAVQVQDLGSKNGTRVDHGDSFKAGVRPARHHIRIGEHDIEILGLATPSTPPRLAPTFAEPEAAAVGTETKFFPSSKRLDLNQHRLTLLMSLAERLGGTFERKQLLEQALDSCCAALGFERGLIAVKTQRGDTELPVTRHVVPDAQGVYPISRTLINRALLGGERAVVNNPATDLLGNLSESLVRFPIRSALCVPIMNRDEILGVIYGDRVKHAASYTTEDVDFLAAIAQQVGLGLANLRLLQARLRAEKMEAELRQARDIQRALLPERPLVLPGVRIEGLNEPTSSIGGDYYDYFEGPDGRVVFVIADVTGHGLPAAILMSNLQAAVHVALGANRDLPAVAGQINRLICENSVDSVFITAIIGTIDPRRRLIEYVNAGHPHPICIGAERGYVDDDNSLPFGIEPGEEYGVQTIAVPSNGIGLLLYTDGLSEAFDAAGRSLGLEPVIAALRGQRDLDPAALLRTARSTLRDHLREIANGDDMTLLAMHLE